MGSSSGLDPDDAEGKSLEAIAELHSPLWRSRQQQDRTDQEAQRADEGAEVGEFVAAAAPVSGRTNAAMAETPKAIEPVMFATPIYQFVRWSALPPAR